MKFNILILKISLVVFITGSGYGQCDNKVSTDPENAHNMALPDYDHGQSGVPYNQDERYLNGLNWWQPNSYQLTNMQYNPTQPYTQMSNIQSNNGLLYYDYLFPVLGAEVMNPQNGWELMLVNLGYFPDNVTPHNNIDLQTVPYIVVYNRYTGVLRVFVQYGYNTTPNEAVDGVKIGLNYVNSDGTSGNASGILRLGEGKDRALDKNTVIEKVSSIAPPNGATNFWMSSDFQLTYDPCVCFYPTNLKLEFEFFSNTSFDLYGRSITLEEEIVDDNGNIVNGDFLTGVDNTYSGLQENNGYVLYKNMEALVDEYIEEMEEYKTNLYQVNQHNEKVEKNLAIIKAFKTVINLGLTAAMGTTSWGDLSLKAPELFFTTESESDKKKKKAFYSAVQKILGKKLDTYISENYKKKSKPTKPTMPTASFSEMKFSGSLDSQLPIGGPFFATPGSFVNHVPNNQNDPDILDLPSDEPYGYPIYNQPVGVFALLETPKVEFSSAHSFYGQTSYPSGITPNHYYYVNTEGHTYQFKIKEPLKYTYNNSLDIEEVETLCSFVIIAKKNDAEDAIQTLQGYPYNPNEQFIRAVHDKANSVNVLSEEVNTDQFDVLDNFVFYPSTVYQDENHLHSGTPIDIDDSIVFETIQVPVDAFNEFISSVGLISQVGVLESSSYLPDDIVMAEGYEYEFELKLKIQSNITYSTNHDNEDNDPHEYTYSFTYDVDELTEYSAPYFEEDLPNTTGNLGQYPQNLYFSETHFDGSAIDGCNLNGNVYTCQCWEDLIIDGNITVDNGYTVYFNAGHQAQIVDNAIVDPEAILQIIPLLDYSNPMPETSSEDVAYFCRNNDPNYPSYQANITKSQLENNSLNDEGVVEQDKVILDFVLYPNPTNFGSWVSFNVEKESKVGVVLTDMTGKIVKNISSQDAAIGQMKLYFDTSDLSTGFYLCTVKVGNKTKTKRVIVQK